MQTVSEEEREWNRLVRTENRRCPACGQFIRFDERETYAKRNLCAYCAEMIPPDEEQSS
jgi:predicted nucleic acid-binding Zn ribbon protein